MTQAATDNGVLLTVEHMTMRFGGIVAIDDLSFAARKGEITAIIGPNGAGKTTVFNCLTGFYKPTIGRIALHHPSGTMLLERMEGFRIAQRGGVARTFQNIRLFGRMTVLENLIVAQHNALMRASAFTVAGLLGLPRYRRAERRAVDKAREWLDKVQLLDVAGLGGGQPAVRRPAEARNRPLHVQRPVTAVPRRARRRPQPARVCRAERDAAQHPRRTGHRPAAH